MTDMARTPTGYRLVFHNGNERQVKAVRYEQLGESLIFFCKGGDGGEVLSAAIRKDRIAGIEERHD